MSDSTEDYRKYLPRWYGYHIAEIDIRFIVLCDQDICTTVLLEKVYLFAKSAEERSQGINDDYHDPAIYNTIEGIAAWFTGLFSIDQVKNAISHLADKGYITAWQSFGSASLKIECNLDRVNTDIKSVKPISRLIHTQEHSIREARKIAEERKHWKRVTPDELNKANATEAEVRKVKYHNSRAKNVGLPATLTIEQWLQTLDHFDWQCAYCGGKYSLLEHFVPLSHGQGTTWDNCVPACDSCNTTKQAWNPLADWGPNMQHLKEGIDRVQAYLATRK